MMKDKLHTDDNVFQQEQGNKVFLWSLKITTGLALCVVIALLVSYSYSNMETIDQFLESSRPWLLFWRILLFLVLIGYWPQASAMYAQWSGMNDEQLDRMLSFRWRIGLWLLVMEAVLSQGVLSEFVNSFTEMEIK